MTTKLERIQEYCAENNMTVDAFMEYGKSARRALLRANKLKKAHRKQYQRFTLDTKPFPEGELCCENCKVTLRLVWINTGDSILCFDCFEKLYPRYAAINRFKKHNTQLEMPL